MVTSTTKVYASISSVFLAVAFAVTVFGWGYIQSKGNELITQVTTVADYSAREQRYTELSRLVEETQVERSELTSYFLTEDKTIDFLAEIEKIAREQRVELTTNSLSKEELEGGFDTLVVSFAVSGTNSHVHQLLEIFETLPYHSFVSKVALTKKEGREEFITEGTIELTASLIKSKI